MGFRKYAMNDRLSSPVTLPVDSMAEGSNLWQNSLSTGQLCHGYFYRNDHGGIYCDAIPANFAVPGYVPPMINVTHLCGSVFGGC